MNSRAKAHQAYVPTDIEHLANVVTHGVCIIMRCSAAPHFSLHCYVPPRAEYHCT